MASARSQGRAETADSPFSGLLQDAVKAAVKEAVKEALREVQQEGSAQSDRSRQESADSGGGIGLRGVAMAALATGLVAYLVRRRRQGSLLGGRGGGPRETAVTTGSGDTDEATEPGMPPEEIEAGMRETGSSRGSADESQGGSGAGGSESSGSSGSRRGSRDTSSGSSGGDEDEESGS